MARWIGLFKPWTNRMVKILKPGKVVILLAGRHAGQKALVIKSNDEGTKEKSYGHCVVAGLERPPLKVTKSMSQKKKAKRQRMKTFIKTINNNHLMPTRYTLDIDDKKVIGSISAKDPNRRSACKAAVRAQFTARYNQGKNKWFFSKLRF